MTKEVFSRVLDYNTGLTGASVLSALTIKYGAFQGFICQDYTVVQVITDAQGNDVTAQMGLRGVTLSPGIYISMASGDSIYSIILSSGSVILYDLGADMSSVPGVSDLITAFSTRATVDGATLESTSCIDGPLMPYFKKASFYLTPSAYKGGKLYAQKPITGNGDLTWVRGSDGFRTNSSGLVQRMPWNLLTNSNELASQQLQALGKYTISSNVAISPDGTQNADKFVITGTDSYQGVVKTPIPNGTYTISMFAKASGKNWVFFYEIGSPSGINGVWFNISTGQIGSIGSAWSNVTITNVGNDWYRCSATTTLSATNYLYWLVADSNSNPTVTANGTDGVLMWGLQFVEGTTAQTYLPTTDRLGFPRLDYTYGSCPSALLEPQRTNLVVNSGWTGGGATPTSWNSFITGTTTAVTSIKNNSVTAYRFSGTSQRAFFVQSYSATSGVTYSMSIFVESVTTTAQVAAVFLPSGTGTTTYYKDGVLINATDTIVANSKYTCVFVATATALVDWRFGLGCNSGVTADFILSMPQVEIGAYSTTFILSPVGATATRVADSFSRSNIYTNGLISASGGTWFVELRNNISYVRDAFGALWLGDNSSSFITGNSLSIRNQSSTSARLSIVKTIASSATTIFLTTTDTVKIAIKWNGTSADVFVNGVKEVSATAFTTTNMEFLAQNAIVPMFIQQMALFPAPLTDTECAAMTTI